MRSPMGAASRLERGTEGMPEVQKPVLEHAAPKADQNQRLDGHSADASLPDSNSVVNLVNSGRREPTVQTVGAILRLVCEHRPTPWVRLTSSKRNAAPLSIPDLCPSEER